MGELKQIVAIVMVFGMPIAICVAVLAYRYRRQKLVNEVVLKLAEKGQPVPPELFVEPVRPRSELRRALTWLMVGLGIVVYGVIDSDRDIVGAGVIPLLIGVGFFIAYWLENRNPPSAQ